MHRRLGSETLQQLAFQGEKQPEFIMEKMQMGRYILLLNLRITKRKIKLELCTDANTKEKSLDRENS